MKCDFYFPQIKKIASVLHPGPTLEAVQVLLVALRIARGSPLQASILSVLFLYFSSPLTFSFSFFIAFVFIDTCLPSPWLGSVCSSLGWQCCYNNSCEWVGSWGPWHAGSKWEKAEEPLALSIEGLCFHLSQTGRPWASHNFLALISKKD